MLINIKNSRVDTNLKFYEYQIFRVHGKKVLFNDTMSAYLYLVFGDDWETYAPNTNGYRGKRPK